MFGRHLPEVYVLGDALLEKPEYLVLGNRSHISRDLDPVCFIPNQRIGTPITRRCRIFFSYSSL